MRQGGGRYNQGGYIERSEYRRRFSVWGIVASKQIERKRILISQIHIRSHRLDEWFSDT